MNYYIEVEGNTPEELLSAFVEELAAQFELSEVDVIRAIHRTSGKAIIAARPVQATTYQGKPQDVYLPHVNTIKRGNPYDEIIFKDGYRVFIEPNTYLIRRWKAYNSVDK